MQNSGMPVPRIPVSTYRLQFNREFGFKEAREIIPYLHELGISDIYSSPVFKAAAGSLHGYDIVDPAAMNPGLGSEAEYDRYIKEMQKYGMGQILDIVPNHMCVADSENAWWTDVLENGPSSPYATFFDIDWNPVKKELKNKILIPVLGDQYGNVLENQELRLAFEGGAFFVYYYDNRFPVIPKTYIAILKHGMEELETVLPPESPHFVELLSIVTSLTHLPPYTVRDPEKTAERHREKEIVKKRLWALYNESLEVRNFIDENIRIFNGVKGDARSFDLLDRLLSKQTYRLSYWRVATEEINYRRFFDINSLGAIKMESDDVFEITHRLIFRLIREGKVTGLRVDHADGLYNPSEYLVNLQKNCFVETRLAFIEKNRSVQSGIVECSGPKEEILKQYEEVISLQPQFKPFYIIAEKILIKGEKMPEEWPIFSTTGYVFMNSLNGIFVDTKNAKAFEDIYNKFIRSKINFQEITYEKKKLVMQVSMSSEINTLGHYLNNISEKNRHTRDFTLNSLTHVIIEVIAFFPVYRTYMNSWSVKDRDRQYIELAVAKAKRKNPAISASIFDFLKDVLLLRFPESLDDYGKNEWLDFVMRFQQITGPVMAKGLEDTAFYVYNRLVSLNEVGGMPERFGTPLDTFHGQNIERTKFWQNALIASSTHDSKRSEDVRTRINVLSEVPNEWKDCLIRWNRYNKKKRVVVDGQTVPDRNDEYFFYQTLIGAWPVGQMDDAGYDFFKKRIKDYMLKALREAKVNTSWINPNPIYEDALMLFIEAVMDEGHDPRFLKEFTAFQRQISHLGMLNSLSQALLKITSPGVPDFYQGSEIWDYSLVDPDNRRPVDYGLRIRMLEELIKREKEYGASELAKELAGDMEDGRIKQYLIYKALNYRKANRDLFEKGEYIPLETIGDRAECVCAFARIILNTRAIVAAPRFFTRLVPEAGALPAGGEVWKDTLIVIPFADDGVRYRNVFTGNVVNASIVKGATALNLSEVFADFPAALLERIS